MQVPILQLFNAIEGFEQRIGIEGYRVTKKYEDPEQKIKQRQRKNSKKCKDLKYVTKRGSFLEDEAKFLKQLPGPGHYPFQQLWSKKTKSLVKPSKRYTFTQEIMRKSKKQKLPAPGQYSLCKSLKQEDQQNKRYSQIKKSFQDRVSYLDSLQYYANLTPGAGMYNPRDRVQTQPRLLGNKPEEWRKIHAKQENKKKPKRPDMCTYNPQPISFSLFSTIRPSTAVNQTKLGTAKRFKTQTLPWNLGPGKYIPLQKWKGKETEKILRHGLDSISKIASRSVYN